MSQSKNIEIKIRCKDLDKIRSVLKNEGAEYIGLDHQIDTYFNVNTGRLKMREGNIENNLIHYNRPNQSDPKQSDFTLFKTEKGSGLKEILTKAMGIKAIVDKQREIYFIEHVKFHIDQVLGLGSFVEIEVIDLHGTASKSEMIKTCNYYLKLFEIEADDLVENSYSDLILNTI